MTSCARGEVIYIVTSYVSFDEIMGVHVVTSCVCACDDVKCVHVVRSCVYMR